MATCSQSHPWTKVRRDIGVCPRKSTWGRGNEASAREQSADVGRIAPRPLKVAHHHVVGEAALGEDEALPDNLETEAGVEAPRAIAGVAPQAPPPRAPQAA